MRQQHSSKAQLTSQVSTLLFHMLSKSRVGGDFLHLERKGRGKLTMQDRLRSIPGTRLHRRRPCSRLGCRIPPAVLGPCTSWQAAVVRDSSLAVPQARNWAACSPDDLRVDNCRKHCRRSGVVVGAHSSSGSTFCPAIFSREESLVALIEWLILQSCSPGAKATTAQCWRALVCCK